MSHVDEHAKQYDNENRKDHSKDLKDQNTNDVKVFIQQSFTLRSEINGAKLQALRGDITKISVDAIVNAANEVLEGGGGIDQAIHRVAGPALAEECKKIPKDHHGARCYTGDAKITGSHNITTCKYILHTVGPYLDDNGQTQPTLLASCYKKCLDMCQQHNIKSIAFPCISTGYYGYPMVDAAKVAVQTVTEWLERNNHVAKIEKVVFVVFNELEETIYKKLVE
jgi:O-acetyl-ADP-ribose deacetylase (regulator of RNase III)